MFSTNRQFKSGRSGVLELYDWWDLVRAASAIMRCDAFCLLRNLGKMGACLLTRRNCSIGMETISIKGYFILIISVSGGEALICYGLKTAGVRKLNIS